MALLTVETLTLATADTVLVEDLSFTIAPGERFGLIRFGSRLDIYLPNGVEPLVCIGQTMIAGETVLADLEGTEPARSGGVR